MKFVCANLLVSITSQQCAIDARYTMGDTVLNTTVKEKDSSSVELQQRRETKLLD